MSEHTTEEVQALYVSEGVAAVEVAGVVEG